MRYPSSWFFKMWTQMCSVVIWVACTDSTPVRLEFQILSLNLGCLRRSLLIGRLQ